MFRCLQEKFPSLTERDRWEDREDHIFAENQHCEISVSEYCGLVAVCIRAKDCGGDGNGSSSGLHTGWTNAAVKGFRDCLHKAYSGCALRSLGSASNGEQFFELATTPGSVVTSKEGRLPMFA